MPKPRARQRTSRMTLRRALFAIGGVLVGINVASALWSMQWDRARVERDARRNFSNLTALLSAQTTGSLEAVDLLLRDTGREIGAGGAIDPATLERRLSDRISGVPQIRSLVLLGADGRVLADTERRIPIGLDLSDRAFFTAQRDREVRERYVSEPFQGRASGQWEFAVAERVAGRGGRFAGVLAAKMDIPHFDRVYRSLDIGPEGFVELTTGAGTVITRVPRDVRLQHADIDRLLAALKSEGHFVDWSDGAIEGRRVRLLISAAAIPDLPFHVFVGAPERAVFAPWREEAVATGLQTLLTSAAMLALIAFAARELRRRAATDDALRGRQEMLDLAQQAARAAAFEWQLGAGKAENRWSRELEPMLGLAPGTYDGTYDAWKGQVHPEDRPGVEDAIERARETGDASAEYRVVHRDGSVHWLQLQGRLLADADGNPDRMVGFMLDIDDRRRAEAKRQRQKVLLDELIASAPEAIVICNDAWQVTRVNREFTRMFGYAAEEVLGLDVATLVVPEDRTPESEGLRSRLSRGEHVGTETVRRRKDGSLFDVSLLGAPILVGGERIGALLVLHDISERKLAEAEQARLQNRLRQAEKMEAVGRLAGGIAHDFNNILGGILGYAEMAVAETAEGTPVQRYARNILTGANRARDLVDQILTYSRSQRAKRAAVDIGHIVGETLELVRGSLPGGITLDAALPAAPLVVIGDPSQLHQIVMNLCTNALHAMKDSGTLRVALEPVDVAAERPLTNGVLAPGRYVRLTVADTGSGMDAATLARIFEPFFTTKQVGRGTGLGLALVYGIVTDSGGAIQVTSELRRGSTFEIYLPRTEARPTAVEPTEAQVPRGAGERVLLVDDEEPLTTMTAELLAQLGYEATPFTDGRAALEAFKEAPQAFQVLVTDEVMPALTGTELARRVRLLRPDLPIVLMSGYSGPLLTQQALGAGVSELVRKPVQSRELAAALARVLRRAA